MLVRDASFPCGTSGKRTILEESIDINDPIGSITKLLVEVQIYQHPSSLIKDWALGNNMISHVIQIIYERQIFEIRSISQGCKK